MKGAAREDSCKQNALAYPNTPYSRDTHVLLRVSGLTAAECNNDNYLPLRLGNSYLVPPAKPTGTGGIAAEGESDLQSCPSPTPLTH